jgi:hypothetical protein
LHAPLQFSLRYQFSDEQWETEPICVQSLPLIEMDWTYFLSILLLQLHEWNGLCRFGKA